MADWMANFQNEDSEEDDMGYEIEDCAVPNEYQQEDDPDARALQSIDPRMDALPPPVIRENMDPRGNWVSGNTGPKGVKEDFKEAKRNLAEINMRQKMHRDRQLEKMATGQTKFVLADLPVAAAKDPNGDNDSESDSDFASDEEDFQKYKLERLKLVEASLPSFGSHDRLSKEEWTTTIKNTHELVFVVCHLYENGVPACTMLNLVMEALAPQFPHVRFCRVRSQEAIKGYKRVGLPTMMIYRGGDMVSSFIRVNDAIGKEITDLTVAQFLHAQGVFADPTAVVASAKNNTKTSSTQNIRRTAATAALSDDDENSD